jgi:integrase
MASNVPGVVERKKGSGVWWIRWTDFRKKRRWERVGRRSDAITLLEKRRSDSLLRKKLPELYRGATTFGALIDHAIRHSKDSNGKETTAELELKYENYIRPAFGLRPAATISTADISNWLLEQGEEREWSSGTRNRYAAAFSLAFRLGVDEGKIEINPCRKLKRKKESTGRTRFLTAGEEQAIRDVILKRCPRNLPAFIVSIHTGLRASEQWRLVWADVDFDHRILTARATKNGDPERHIPLNDVALAALKEQAAAYPRKRRQHDRVFLNSDGNPMQTHRDWFDPVIQESDLSDCTWHVNRHTFASRLVMAGVNLKAVQVLMGHKTISMTMRYAHLAPDHLTAAVATLVPSGSSDSSSEVVTKSVTGRSRGQRRKTIHAVS